MVQEHNCRSCNQPRLQLVVAFYLQADGKDSDAGSCRKDQIDQEDDALSPLLDIDQRKVGPLRSGDQEHQPRVEQYQRLLFDDEYEAGPKKDVGGRRQAGAGDPNGTVEALFDATPRFVGVGVVVEKGVREQDGNAANKGHGE